MSQTRPLKLLAELVSGAGFPAALQGQSDNELPFLKVGDLGRMDSRGYFAEPPDTIDRTTARALGAVMIAPHTPVMAKIGAAINLRRVGVTSSVSCIDNNMVAVVPRTGTHSRYLYYVLNLLDPALMLNGGAVPNINMNWMRHTSLPWFSFDVQRQIADYLDHETAEIDAFIADLVTMKALEYERLAATVDRCVTKGLNRDVTSVDSLHPAIGTYPAHWKLLRLKHVAVTLIGLTYDPADIVPDPEDGVLVLRAGNIQQGQVVGGDDVYVACEVPEHLRLRPGDILVCARNGSASLVGKNALISAEFAGQTFGAFMAVIRSQTNPFLRWFLSAGQFRSQAGSFSTSTINQLTASTLNNMTIALPPQDEQDQIVEHLGRVDEIVRKSIADIDAAISLAKERRAALITAAVTGQIDVSGFGTRAARATQPPGSVSTQTAIDESR